MSDQNSMTHPTHVTFAQAWRLLGRSKSTVHGWMKQGGPLEAETWYGLRMIPLWRVMEQLRKQEPPVQGAPIAEPAEVEVSANAEGEEGWDD